MVEPDGSDQGVYEEEPPRSIFSALWFRVLIVILVLGVIAAVAVPYVLDIVNPPVTRKTASVPGRPTSPAPAVKPTTPETMPPTTSAPPTAAPPATTPPSAISAPSGRDSQTTVTPTPARPKPTTSTPTTTPAPTAPRATAKKSAESGKASTESAKMTTAVEPPKSTVAKAIATASAGGAYWVQVGAFKNETTAKRLAAKLREQSYEVQESVKTATAGSSDAGGAADRYNVFVSGSTPTDLTAKLSTKGLSADAVAGGVVVKPSLPLRDAVALSRDLAADGLRVQVRRAGGGATTAGAPSASTGETLHRVRIGGLADRAAALAVQKELEGKGYKPFIGRGGS